MHRYYIVVSGMVQGVGFRYFVYYTATRLNLTGWVRNCDNGDVEIEVQGEKEILLNFINKIKKGNGFSDVKDVKIKTIEIMKNERSFKIYA
ncbi:acylphosphatase [Caloramator sp. E03]|uniref:acylphosphatase n=1 Tax=Caloramator sp. E03 TaxID=2576307 RepID=UPI0011102900|nr:acylphosphatase [Caloramator sp. E03]QCX32747.1 acylphosphatase [Caloramator sp. E03]